MLIKHLKIFGRRQYSRKVQENNNSMLLCVWDDLHFSQSLPIAENEKKEVSLVFLI